MSDPPAMDSPLKILVVAGEAADRKKVRAALATPGLSVEVSEADGGAVGLAALRDHTFDCALLDHRLPDAAGLDVLRAARTSGVATPLILLTEEGDEALAGEVMRAGANDYLAKSRLNQDLLGHAVRHVVRLHRAQIEASSARALSAESESRFRFLAESIPQIVFTADDDGRIDYHNHRWLAFTGLRAEEGRGDGWRRVAHPDDLPAFLARWNEARREVRTFESECRLRRRDGVYVWHLGRAEPMRDPGGAVVKWFGTFTDIDERKRQAEAIRFLAEASVVLANSLDYEATLSDVARLAVPQIADWCAVDMLDSAEPAKPAESAGVIRRLAVAHVDPSKVQMAWDLLRRYPTGSDDPRNTVARVLRTGKSELHPAISDAQLQNVAFDTEHLELLRSAGIKSVMIVPLLARGRALGAITFVNTETDRPFGPADLSLAEDLARRAATAVDNARLYRDARDAVRSRERTTALLDTMLAAAPVGFAFFDTSFRFVRINRAMADYNGLPPEAHLGRPLAQVSPDMEQKVGPYLRQVLETARPVIDVELHDAAADAERSYLASYYPVKALSGEVLGVGAVVADITERKRAEYRLREETRVTESLYRIGQLLAAELDVHRLVQTVTDEATALTGAGFGAFFHNVIDAGGERYTLYTLSGSPREALEDFPMPRNTEVFAPTFGGEGIVRSADITKDPRYGRNAPYFGMPPGHLPVRSYLAAPVVSRTGKVLGGLFFGHSWVGVFSERDERLVAGIAAQAAIAIDNAQLYEAAVSDSRRRREAMEALQSSEARYRALTEAVPQLVWTALPNGACDYLSQQWMEYTGVPESEQLGLGWLRALHPDDRERVRRVWEDALAGRSPYDLEYRLRRHDGVYRWFKARGLPMRQPRAGEARPESAGPESAGRIGSVVKWFGTCTDIDDQKRAQLELKEAKEQAEAANTAKDQFLAVLSHELRTPLTPVLTTVQSLEAEPGLSPQLRGPLEMIRRNVELEARLIDDLLDLTRIAKNKLELNLQTLDAHEALHSALEICREDIRAKRLTLVTEFRAGRHHVKGDSARLHQVFWNLIKNAVKFTPEGGRITVRTVNESVGGGEVGSGEVGGGEVGGGEVGSGEVGSGEVGSEVVTGREDTRPAMNDGAAMNDEALGGASGGGKATDGNGQAPNNRPSPRPHSPRPHSPRPHSPRPHSPRPHSPRPHSPHPHSPKPHAVSPSRFIVEVRDTGIGIEPHVLPRIFEAFEQGERNITRRFGGLGLGLAISKVLVDMQGGRLTADSAGPGKGAVFAVDLATIDPPRPAVENQPLSPFISQQPVTAGQVAGETARSLGTRDGHRTAPLRILLVDDHEDTNRAFGHLLRSWGHIVATANTVGSAVEIFCRATAAQTQASGERPGGKDRDSAAEAAPFDLLISDIGLPDGSGLDLIRQLHGMAPRSPLRGIALSGFGMEEDVKRSREAGFYAHLTKPVDFQKLRAVIRQVTAGGRAEEMLNDAC